MTEKILGFQTWFKKPIAIKAKQMSKAFTVKTLEGTMKGKANDYLIIGIKGERYPCDKEIFKATYQQKSVSTKNFFKPARQMLEHAIQHGDIPVGKMSTGGLIHLEKETIYYEFFLKKAGFDRQKTVTLEWLEDFCKENAWSCMKCGSIKCAVCQKDLLAAAKKEDEGK